MQLSTFLYYFILAMCSLNNTIYNILIKAQILFYLLLETVSYTIVQARIM